MRCAVAASPEAQTPPERRVDWAVRGPDVARCSQLSRCWQNVILRVQLTATDTDGIRNSPVNLQFSNQQENKAFMLQGVEGWPCVPLKSSLILTWGKGKVIYKFPSFSDVLFLQNSRFHQFYCYILDCFEILLSDSKRRHASLGLVLNVWAFSA